MFKRLKNNNKKGFTLVELIVVLVILAILAALLIPALTGYIDKAKEKQIIAETRQCVMAAQTLVDEAYGTKDVGGAVTVGASSADVLHSDIEKLAEVANGTVSDVKVTNAKVSQLKYTAHGKICTYKPGDSANSDGDYDVMN